MTNEWDSWKVGDKLQCKHTSSGGILRLTKGEIWTLVDIRPGDCWIFASPCNTRLIKIADYGPSDNPSTYFFFPATPHPPYQIGDRVMREAADPGRIPPGSLGTVTDVATDQVIIQWDSVPDETFPYQWPGRAALFSKVSTLQSPKPVLCCSRCGEYNEYAEANQPDGTHRCWQCRADPWR